MSTILKRFLPVLVMSIASVALSTAVHAQAYPSKPITIVVTYPPGGVSDQIARAVGAKMADSMKQPVLIDNRPGGGFQIGVNVAKQAPADGYTLLMGDIGSLALNTSLYSKLSYDAQKDFVPITRLAMAPSLIVVPKASAANSFAELVTMIKTSPTPLSYASQSPGSGGHLFGEMLRRKLQANLTHVAYRGSAPALTDLVGGQVAFFFDPIITSGPFVKDGRLKALALGSPKRSAQFPQVPTLEELGHGDISLVAWFGIAARAGTPQPIIDKLNAEIIKAIRDPEVTRRLTDQGLEVATTTPEEFGRFIASETARWGEVIRQTGIKLE